MSIPGLFPGEIFQVIFAVRLHPASMRQETNLYLQVVHPGNFQTSGTSYNDESFNTGFLAAFIPQ